MKSKYNVNQIIIISVLFVILCLIIILIINKQNNLNKVDEQINNEYIANAICEKEYQTENNYKFYNIENIEFKNDLIVEIKSTNRIEYFDKDNYNGFKANEKVENPKYDDENLIIMFDAGESPRKNNIKYSEYIKELTEDGYDCKTNNGNNS